MARGGEAPPGSQGTAHQTRWGIAKGHARDPHARAEPSPSPGPRTCLLSRLPASSCAPSPPPLHRRTHHLHTATKVKVKGVDQAGPNPLRLPNQRLASILSKTRPESSAGSLPPRVTLALFYIDQTHSCPPCSGTRPSSGNAAPRSGWPGYPSPTPPSRPEEQLCRAIFIHHKGVLPPCFGSLRSSYHCILFPSSRVRFLFFFSRVRFFVYSWSLLMRPGSPWE